MGKTQSRGVIRNCSRVRFAQLFMLWARMGHSTPKEARVGRNGAGRRQDLIEIRRTPEMLGNVANSNVLYKWRGRVSGGLTDRGLGIPVGARGWAAAPRDKSILSVRTGFAPSLQQF